MFEALLNQNDAGRATEVVETILAQGLRCGLTGGLAIAAQLRMHGRPVPRRRLNDIDLVVEGFASIPESLARTFLQHHVHPKATDGRTLLQLIDESNATRIDLFLEVGSTLSRAAKLDEDTGELAVLSVEDLEARATALVCGSLRRRRTIDAKYAAAFGSLRGLGQPEPLAAAWNDHRQQLPGTVDEASREAARLLDTHPELIVVERYSTDASPCDRCREHGPFRPAPSSRIVEILGYV